MIDVNKIYNMDCLEGLKLLDDNSIDSIVTDPPYGLSKEPNIVEVLTHWLNDKEYKHPSKGFMGKEWDSFVPSPTIWKEVLRVLKPGGHLLCFAGTRTYDLMCMSIRLAGFEIRDQMQWIYGSGFPKSHDISKAIDKKLGTYVEGKLLPSSRTTGASATGIATTFRKKTASNPQAPEAQEWDGWGTALKPAHEPIVVARKPISEKTIADNVLKWGTGGINIDDCRVGNGGDYLVHNAGSSASSILQWNSNEKQESSKEYRSTQGRFPANLIFDEEAGKMLDEQSEITTNTRHMSYKRSGGEFIDGIPSQPEKDWFKQETGGASRFFYCAKASKKERGEGNNHPTVKPLSLIKYLITLVTPPNGICLDPFEGSGTHALACKELGFDYIGFELDDTYYNLANKRIEEHIKSKNMIK